MRFMPPWRYFLPFLSVSLFDRYLEHENAKAELKGLMPEDAKEAIGHGIRAKRSKSGAVSFDVLSLEGTSHAATQ
jgi:hypothetical protein